ncbi:MAG: translation initiation factor IF-2 [Flavobacteriales bacterium]|nr:translation initiation factor IF-2 [Flavobacteriales bacterium]
MAETVKTVRLSKAAREVNLGIGRVVEFLGSKGFDIEAKPNTKLDPEMYDLLLQEFAADRDVKQRSKKKNVEEKEVRETVSIETATKPDRKPKQEEEDVFIKGVQSIKEPETVVAKAEDIKVKVVDKIELEKKPEPEAKKEVKEEPKKVVKAEKVVKEEKPKEVKKEDAPVSVGSETKTEKIDEPEPELLEAKADKLSGPTVVGKIDLPPPKAKKVAVSQGENKKRRKRIRKPKVDVDKVAKGGPRIPGRSARRGGPKKELDEKEIQKEIKETLARLSGGGKKQSAKNRRAKRDAAAERTELEQAIQQAEENILKLTEFVSVSELAVMMNKSPNDIISACMSLGIFASINQRLDAETITIIAEEFGYIVEFVSAEIQEAIQVVEDKEEDLLPRSPIVTVMGHVDHGKTSLLDHVRKANVIAGEAGGITQHIGAYNVLLDNGKSITFLDTPGHEAFTAMRARGAQVTDLAIIVIAADDAVMPQTKEAINHAQAAGIPMIFALNKIDRDAANPDKIREELSQMNILLEEWGGKYQSQEISAKQGTNVNELLEKVLVEAEMLELKANPNKKAQGTIIESSLDKGRGFVTTVLVEAGTLRIGDAMLAGGQSGKVKAMFNERGQAVKEAGPAIPVSILGLNGAPNAGDKFNIMEDEKEAREIASKRMQLQREQGVRTQKSLTLDEIGRRIAVGEFKELNIVLKGDVDGSIEALSDSLEKLSTEKVQVKIIHKAVGQISESDILLASASDAIVIGFQVRPSTSARKVAEKEEVQIKLYSVIYAAIEEVKEAMEGMLSAKIEEEILGTAEIREVFKISKVGTIAGCFVLDGKILRNNKVRLIRDGIVIYTGDLGSLKRFKDDVKEVTHGYECGLNIEKFNDIKVGDQVESFHEIEVKQTL